MTIINSVRDIDCWIWDVRADVGCEGYTVALREAIQAAEHPSYGTDWSDWLSANVDALLEEVLEAEEGDWAVIPSSAWEAVHYV